MAVGWFLESIQKH